jgi:Na+-transporting methylmalonyl-CoA/oxaloacetate decarboxylase gamma subunit
MQTFKQALEVSLFGISGVFVVLILFFILTKLMIALAKKFSPKE